MFAAHVGTLLLLATASFAQVEGQENITDAGGRVTLECDGSKMKATVNLTMIFGEYAEGRPADMTLDSCSNTSYTVSGDTIETDFHNCSTNITQTQDYIIQEAILTVVMGSNETSTVITRGGHSAVFTLRCSLDRHLNVSVASGVLVDAADEQTFTKRGETNITAEMKFYTSETFSSEASSPLQVTDFEPIYIQITALENQQLFKFIVEDCYATPSANPMDSTKYMYFNDKCALDSTVKEYPAHNNHNKFSHSIHAFRFIQVKGQVFFHCRLLVCKNSSSTAECTQTCFNRKRRAIVRNRRAIQNDGLERVYVNSGMVKYQRKPSCKNTACPQNSRCHNLYPAICRCDDGYVMNWERKTCVKENILIIKNLHLDQEFIPAYAYPTSPEFIRLAQHVEHHLMTSYVLHHDVIKGVKVIGAREGSVVVDVQLLHSDTVTSQHAFESFVDSVLQSEVNGKILRIKTRFIPVLLQVQNKGGIQLPVTLVAIVAVAVPLVVVMFVVSVFLLFKRRSSVELKAVKDIPSYDNKGVQLNAMS